MEIDNPLFEDFFDSWRFPFVGGCALRGEREVLAAVAVAFPMFKIFCQSAIARL